jgi:hypothetical protein
MYLVFVASLEAQPRTKDTGCLQDPSECGKVYVGWTGLPMVIRLKEHQWHIHLECLEKSVVAAHSISQGHRIQFHSASKLATEARYMDCIVREAIEIELHPYYSSKRCFLSQ